MMCGKRFSPAPCWNLKCPHNLFWEELMLNGDRIRVTRKALEIGNCCCLITEPWTVEEIEAAWGIPKEGLRQFEAMAWKKITMRNAREEATKSLFS
jgi:hypothetical protein